MNSLAWNSPWNNFRPRTGLLPAMGSSGRQSHSETALPAARRDTLKNSYFSHKRLPMMEIKMENPWHQKRKPRCHIRWEWHEDSMRTHFHTVSLFLQGSGTRTYFFLHLGSNNSTSQYWLLTQSRKQQRFRNPLTLPYVPENSVLWWTIIPHMIYLRHIDAPCLPTTRPDTDPPNS